MKFAPAAYRTNRVQTASQVEKTLLATKNLRAIGRDLLSKNPSVLPTLRMCTCPPLAVDRLIGLSGVSANLVKSMERKNRLPPRMLPENLNTDLERIGTIVTIMADRDIFVWLDRKNEPSAEELSRASTIVADRLCGSIANPIIRNAQEQRQLTAISDWLTKLNYTNVPPGEVKTFDQMEPGTFSLRLNVPVEQEGAVETVNISVDAVVMPKASKIDDLPVLIEAKAAGDFANVNKRRKEEAMKMSQLRRTYGNGLLYILFLCGYFDTGYLGYEAAEGIDWIWEHRIDDFYELGL